MKGHEKKLGLKIVYFLVPFYLRSLGHLERYDGARTPSVLKKQTEKKRNTSVIKPAIGIIRCSLLFHRQDFG